MHCDTVYFDVVAFMDLLVFSCRVASCVVIGRRYGVKLTPLGHILSLRWFTRYVNEFDKLGH
jgi:hypothetical protein